MWPFKSKERKRQELLQIYKDDLKAHRACVKHKYDMIRDYNGWINPDYAADLFYKERWLEKRILELEAQDVAIQE